MSGFRYLAAGLPISQFAVWPTATSTTTQNFDLKDVKMTKKERTFYKHFFTFLWRRRSVIFSEHREILKDI